MLPATIELPSSPANADEIGVEGLFLGASVERINIAADGKRFRCWFMTPGIVDYTDVDGGKELIRKPAIDESLNSLVGCPLTIGHVPTSLTNFEDVSNGTIDKVGYDAEKGWHFCEGTIDTDQARLKIEAGWGVSVGTRVRRADYAGPGYWLNNQYDREITKFKFHHLALVEPGKKPRFEDAEIVRTNSTKTPMFKWIRKIAGATAGDQPTETVSALSPDTKLDLGGGKSATIKEIVEVSRNNSVRALATEDLVEFEGVRYNFGDCVKAYREKNGLSTERSNATETPEAKIAREVSEASTAVATANTELDAATAVSERANSTDAEKAVTVAAKAKHEAAITKAGKVTERFNSMTAAATAAKAAKDASDKKAADAAAELERSNATKAADEAKKLADAEKARKAAADSAKIAKDAEIERENAARRSGAESFNILGGARERRTSNITASVPSGTIQAKAARGKKLFGSN